jgi:hypothetical protein
MKMIRALYEEVDWWHSGMVKCILLFLHHSFGFTQIMHLWIALFILVELQLALQGASNWILYNWCLGPNKSLSIGQPMFFKMVSYFFFICFCFNWWMMWWNWECMPLTFHRNFKQGLWLVFGNLMTFSRSFEWMFTNYFNCMLGRRLC